MLTPFYAVAFPFRPLRNNQPVFFAAGTGKLPVQYPTRKKCTLHDQIDAHGIYVILGVQKRAFNRQEAFKERGVYFHFWNPKTNDEC